jgi:deoxyhypusine synthase
MPTKKELLSTAIRHIDITAHNVVALVDSMKAMAFSARDLNRAAEIYVRMLEDRDCGIILCLAGSLISAGLKKVFVEMVRNRMVDAIVSTGANIVDQDFFEALGFQHYIAPEEYKSGTLDGELRELMIDRIYDTFIDEEELRLCDETVQKIADALDPRPYSSREFIRAMGAWLEANKRDHDHSADCRYCDEHHRYECVKCHEVHTQVRDSIVYQAYKNDVPIFCPAFSDCSAGFGLVAHQHARFQKRPDAQVVTIDSVKDFYELTQLKMHNPTTGIFMVGGGVPKNFTQDIVVCAEVLGEDAPMHKYAVQVTVADVRDGALSSSTLKEASSWGKVDTTFEQMVYSEATLAVPLIAGYGYHKRSFEKREAKRWNRVLERVAVAG